MGVVVVVAMVQEDPQTIEAKVQLGKVFPHHPQYLHHVQLCVVPNLVEQEEEEVPVVALNTVEVVQQELQTMQI